MGDNATPPAQQPLPGTTTPASPAPSPSAATPAQPDLVAKLTALEAENATLKKAGSEAIALAKQSKAETDALRAEMKKPEFITKIFTELVGAKEPVDPQVAIKNVESQRDTLHKHAVKLAQERTVLEKMLAEPNVDTQKLVKAVKMFRVEHSDALELGDDLAPKNADALNTAFGSFKASWPEFFKAPTTPAPTTTAAPAAPAGPPFTRTPATPNPPSPAPTPADPAPPHPSNGPLFGWGSKDPFIPQQ